MHLSPQTLLAHARTLEALVRSLAREEVLPRCRQTESARKSDGSLCTEADLAMQRRLGEELPKLLPGAVLGEEMTPDEQAHCWGEGSKGSMWCIDPIDGTTNFANGIPFFGVSVAWMVEHESRIGLVHNPVTGESFYAARGAGAFLNGEPLPLRPHCETLADAVAGVDFKRIGPRLGDDLAVRPPYYSQRNFGSSALEWCFLAAGRLDVYIHGGQKLWDYAAGHLILAEAGGACATFDGGTLMAGPDVKRSVIAATSPALFAQWRNWIGNHG